MFLKTVENMPDFNVNFLSGIFVKLTGRNNKKYF